MNWKKIALGTFTLKRLFRSTIIIYIMATLLAYFFAQKLIFPYNQSSYSNELNGLELIKSTDGTEIATRFWQADREKYLVLYFHGNYLDLGHLDEIAAQLNTHNYSVLALDYRGYGMSKGQPSEKTCYEDAQALYEQAIKKGYQKDNIIIMGRSVGTGIAADLASMHKSKALVLISPYVSIYRVMTHIPLIAFDKFNTLAKINQINSKLFIAHGEDDAVIPSWHSETLFNSFSGEKLREVFPRVGHNDIWQVPSHLFLDKLDKFIN